MKRFLLVAGVVAVLLAVLTATSFAAWSPQGTAPQAAAPGASNTQANPIHGLGAWFQGMMQRMGPMQSMGIGGGATGAGHMGSGGMMGHMGGTQGMPGMMGGAQMGFGRTAAGTPTGQGYGRGADGTMMGVGDMHVELEELLGISDDELERELAQAKTLVQIAAAKGITEEQLVNGIMAGRKTAMDQMVSAGRMTQAQADAMLAGMREQVKIVVNLQGPHTGAEWGMGWGAQSAGTMQPGQATQGNQQAPGYRFGGRMHR